MKIRARLFQITGIFIVFQFLLGGLASNNFLEPQYHIVLGFVILALAVASMVVAVASKPSLQSLKICSALLVVLLVLQVPLGFALFHSGNVILSVAHVTNAIAILVTVFAGYFVARRFEINSLRAVEMKR